MTDEEVRWTREAKSHKVEGAGVHTVEYVGELVVVTPDGEEAVHRFMCTWSGQLKVGNRVHARVSSRKPWNLDTRSDDGEGDGYDGEKGDDEQR